MDTLSLRQLLEQIRTGQVSFEDALDQFGDAGVADLGYAHVDLHRRARCGFPEVIFCEGKTCEWVGDVVRKLIEHGQHCLATRVNPEQSAYLAQHFPKGQQDRLARTFWLPAGQPPAPAGRVVVITAGTSDLPV